jgi:hypothetical protein
MEESLTGSASSLEYGLPVAMERKVALSLE